MANWVLPAVAVGAVALGGFYLFGTEDGKKILDNLMGPDLNTMEGLSKYSKDKGYDDPFKYFKGNEDYWDPSSKKYKKLMSRLAADAKSQHNKKVQNHYIESYLADAF